MPEKRPFDWLGKKAKKRQPKITLVRVLWRMKGVLPHGAQAAIYRVETGLELRITYKGDVVETMLSRAGGGQPDRARRGAPPDAASRRVERAAKRKELT